MSAGPLPRSPFLDRQGAVEASGADAGVAAHYGNPFPEQRALASGAAVVDLSHRGVLAVTGPDRLAYLDAVTSQSIAGLAPGESAETLLLGQTGRIEHVLRVVDDGTTTWLLVEGGETEALHAWLESMRFMMRVEVADRTGDYAAVGWFADVADRSAGTDAAGTVAVGTVAVGRDAVGGDAVPGDAVSDDDAARDRPGPSLPVAAPDGVPVTWEDPWRSVAAGGHQYADEGHPYEDWTWRESLVGRADLARLTDVPAAGILALEALRIAARRPRFATEVDEKTIPHELDWLRSAVHLTKGCYRGQETIAKVHNLGHPPRRLVLLHLDGSDAVLPAAGDEVLLGDKPVGRITSVARHWELGPVALAVVKRMTDPEATLTVPVGETVVAAAQEVIVPPSAGATANVPRLPRL